MTDILEQVAGELMTAGEMPAPGSWKSALYRDDAPGAALDGQPWARSWGQFLAAVLDPWDSAARERIAQVRADHAARLRNAGLAEDVPSAGGFLVPEYLRSQVMSFMTSAVVRPRAMVLPMTSLRLGVPNLDNPSQHPATQALGGMTFAWTEEGAGITPTAPKFGRTVMEARKAAGYLQDVPDELIDDAPALGEFLGRVIPQGYSWFEDDSFINGTGTGEPQGILNAPCAITTDRAVSATVGAADIVSMYKQLHPQSKCGDTAAWLVSDGAFGAILDIALQVGSTPTSAIAGTSLWLSWSEAGKCWMLLGQPLYPSDHMPALGTTGDVVLADLAHFIIGDRMEMTIERSEQGQGFGSDTSNFRVKTRLDGRYWIQSSVTLENDSVVSPVVILSSAT